MASSQDAKPSDSVRSVIHTLLDEAPQDEFSALLTKAGTSYKDFGFGLRFYRMQTESLIAFRRAREKQPWSFKINFQVAIQELRCGEPDSAVSSALRAWSGINQSLKRNALNEYLNEQRSRIARLVGDAYCALGNEEEAALWWQTSVRSAVNKTTAAVNVSRRLIRSGQSQAARRVLEEQVADRDAAISRELAEVDRIEVARARPAADTEQLPRRVVILLDFANLDSQWRDGRVSRTLQLESLVSRIAPSSQIMALDAFVPDLPGLVDQAEEELRAQGFTIRPIRARWQGSQYKADADAAIAAWAMVYAYKALANEIWIISSDEDFAMVVEPARELAPDVKLCFAGVNQNGHSELSVAGDRWLALDTAAPDGSVPIPPPSRILAIAPATAAAVA